MHSNGSFLISVHNVLISGRYLNKATLPVDLFKLKVGQEKKVLRLFKLSRDPHENRQDTVENDTSELEMWVECFSSIF